MTIKIALLKGDGIGPEVVNEAVKVLQKVLAGRLETVEALLGGVAIDKTGHPFPETTRDICSKADAILLGAVGGPKWDSGTVRPEQGLLGIRKAFNLFANLRPVKIFPELIDASPLKPERVAGVDIMIVRELTGGVYFGQPKGIEKDRAYNTMIYTTPEVERIARTAFEIARTRSKRLTSVDKANVLEVSQFWRSVVERVAREFPDVTLNHLYVDNCAMQLVVKPQQFDVIVTSNLFGDILSDEAAVISGSIGLLASASLNDSKFGLYEPIHGSAPDIAGQNKANPLATILSAAMMLRYSLNLTAEANAIEQAVQSVLKQGYRTGDIMSQERQLVSTSQMGDLVSKNL